MEAIEPVIPSELSSRLNECDFNNVSLIYDKALFVYYVRERLIGRWISMKRIESTNVLRSALKEVSVQTVLKYVEVVFDSEIKSTDTILVVASPFHDEIVNSVLFDDDNGEGVITDVLSKLRMADGFDILTIQFAKRMKSDFLNGLKQIKSNYLTPVAEIDIPEWTKNYKDIAKEIDNLYDTITPGFSTPRRVEAVPTRSVSPSPFVQSVPNQYLPLVVTPGSVPEQHNSETQFAILPVPDSPSISMSSMDIGEINDKIGEVIRRVIRSNKIKLYRRINVNEKCVEMLSEILSYLTRFDLVDIVLERQITSSPLFVGSLHKICRMEKIVPCRVNLLDTLNILFKDEQTAVLPSVMSKNEIDSISKGMNLSNSPIIGDEIFILSHEKARYLYDKLPTLKDGFDNLNYYLGGYLFDLDLTSCYITGSAIPACMLEVPSTIYFGDETDRKSYIDAYYPRIYTLPEKRFSYTNEITDILQDHSNKVIITYNSGTKKVNLKYDGRVILFDIIDGADVDIAVDPSLSLEEFDNIAKKHHAVITKYYRDASLEKVVRENKEGVKSHMWEIKDIHMRSVQIYQASIGHILTHHVAPVRGFVTKDVITNSITCKLAASCLLSSVRNSCVNYYYFAGKKSKPQDVILKYYQRGYSFCDVNHGIETVINEIIERDPKWKGLSKNYPPSISICGNFNILSINVDINLLRQNFNDKWYIFVNAGPYSDTTGACHIEN